MRRVMRVTLTFALIFLMQNAHAELHDDLIIKKDAAVNAIILSLVIDPNLSERLNKAGGNVQAGQSVCRRFGGSGCSYVSSIGEGVCRAGGGSGCSYVGSVGEGICRAGGGSGCSYVSTAQQGLEKIPNKDRYWYWDEFSDQYGNTLWRCRGSQTGRFAENEKCAGQSRDDNRWPG